MPLASVSRREAKVPKLLEMKSHCSTIRLCNRFHRLIVITGFCHVTVQNYWDCRKGFVTCLFGFHEGLSFLPSISLWVHSFSPVVCHKITLSICIAEYMKKCLVLNLFSILQQYYGICKGLSVAPHGTHCRTIAVNSYGAGNTFFCAHIKPTLPKSLDIPVMQVVCICSRPCARKKQANSPPSPTITISPI